MTKIVIDTIIDNTNYGNRLQNLALQETIKKMNYDVETLLYKSTGKRLVVKKSSLMKKISFSNINQHLHKIVSKNKKNRLLKERERNFNRFNEKYISFTRSEKNPQIIVTGSDQVWNPYYKDTKIHLLEKFTDSVKISYAASFGIDTLPDNVKEVYKKSLSNYSEIMVRENEGAKIVHDLINTEVEVVLDPTFLLTHEEWNNIISNNETNEKYVLVFFLGHINNEYRKIINNITEEYNCNIMYLNNIKYDKLFTINPLELLELVKNAEYICTDSFHITAFSIIFNKNFNVFSRIGTHNMNSRITTLLSNLDIMDRVIETKSYKYVKNNIDYIPINKKLSNLRERSIELLKESLDKSLKLANENNYEK